MTVPPYVTACVLTIGVAHYSDKTKQRGYFIIGALILAIVGFIMAISTAADASLARVTYAGCFLACCGFFPAFPGVISWLANNLAGSYKRAIAMALQISEYHSMNCLFLLSQRPLSQETKGPSTNHGFIVTALGNMGGLVGSNIYLAREKPHYRLGYGISIGLMSLGTLAAVGMRLTLNSINKKRDRYAEENGGPDGIIAKHGEVTLNEMGDRSPLFRYTL
jgi:MFS family permease